jgi:hypothetical protein
MKLEFFIVSESLSIDQATNRVSIFNVLEELGASQFPIGLPFLTATSCFLVEEGDADKEFVATCRVRAKQGVVDDLELRLTFTARHSARHRLVHRLDGRVAILGQGDVVFELLLNEEHKATHTVSFYGLL